MSKQLTNTLRPMMFAIPSVSNVPDTSDVWQAVQELSRRLDQRDRELLVLQTELQDLLASKPDTSELLPTVFKS